MGARLNETWKLIKAAAGGVAEDKVPRLGAALSYYTIFAIPPLFMIVIFIASLVFNPEDVRSQMFSEVGGLIGKKSAEAIESAIAVQYHGNKGVVASMIAIVTLIATATGLFIELQDALNTIWRVEAKPGNGLLGFIRIRLLSFAMVVGIGFLLLVSLVISAALAAFSKYVSGLMPGLGVLWVVANDLVAFGVITLLFAMIFKVLPDVRIPWRSVWVGAVVTSLLFTVGKFLLGWYLGRSSTVSAYGAAGSIVLVLLWVYYSSQILFFGAELTKAYAKRHAEEIHPAHYAGWISPEKQARFTKRKPGINIDRKSQLVDGIKEEIASLRDVVHHR
jgi:membrane protein